MRLIAAGELAGAWASFGGIGAQWATSAQIASLGLMQNQEIAARVIEAQNSDWRKLARGRRDFAKAAHQLSEPYQPRILRVAADQREDLEGRVNEAGKGEKHGTE